MPEKTDKPFDTINDLVLHFGLRKTLIALVKYVGLYSAGNGLLGVENGFLIDLKNDLQRALEKYEKHEKEYHSKE